MFPVYKDSRTIKKMIYQSLKILREVSKNFEILIVDDGCPEKTGIIAKKIAKKTRKVSIARWNHTNNIFSKNKLNKNINRN